LSGIENNLYVYESEEIVKSSVLVFCI